MAFLKKISRKINTRIFEKLTMMGRFFENTLKRAGVFTPVPTVETSILCLFQRSQSRLSESQYSNCFKKKTDFFGGHAMVKLVFTHNNTWFLAHVLLSVNQRYN